LPQTSRLLLLSVSLAAFSALGYAQNFAYPLAPGPSQPGTARPHVWIAGSSNPSAVVPAPGDTACGTTDVCYYTPQALQTAYAVNAIAHGNGGAGITIGVVDAFYNSQTEGDLAAYSSFFGCRPVRWRAAA
jgi:subtilase family serine protease